MTFKQLKTRRDFLRLGARTITSIGAAAAFGEAGLVSARAATDTSGYKALVCIFLFGGNDANNMVVPVDTPTYNTYKSIRANLALAQNALVPLGGSNFGLHPSMNALAKLFQKDAASTSPRLAVLTNVGTLVQPVPEITKNGKQVPDLSVPLPVNLFSHSDQVSEWQNAMPQGGATTGWGGRLADLVYSSQAFPPSIGVSGGALQLVGRNTLPTTIGTQNFGLVEDKTLSDPLTSQLQMMQEISLKGGVTLIQAAGNSLKSAIDVAKTVANAAKGQSPLPPFPNTDVGSQLQQVAQIIQIHSGLGANRQIFFVSQGGYDTHSDQINQQAQLLANLSNAMVAFDAAMQQLGQVNNVTTFTESDFSRTFQPNGNAGTDHAWGSHHLIMGGAVQGGQIYGQFPTLALQGPSDSGNRGNWVPTTSADQYGAQLAKWFGVTSQSDLDTVFPNLGKFKYATPKFMGI